MSPGDAYWISDLVNGKEVKHLHLVLTYPEPDSDGHLLVAVVNVSTVRNDRYDKTVVLKKSDYAGFEEQAYFVVCPARGTQQAPMPNDTVTYDGFLSYARVDDEAFPGVMG